MRARAAALDVQLADNAFVFSPSVDGSEHLKPDSVSQRYARLAARLGIAATIHKLRHYSVTELISAGVDVRTVAGRLGHGGGGTTTLKVYAAWVSESDQRAATSLFSRLPARPEGEADPVPQRSDAPYERIAAELRAQIASGDLPVGAQLPTHKQLAEQHGISESTAHRVTALLASEGLVAVSRGQRATVIHQPADTTDQLPDAAEAELPLPPPDTGPSDRRSEQTGQLLNLEIRRLGQVVSKLTAQADPTDPRELRQLLLDAIKRNGQDESQIADYEMDIRHFGES